MSSLLPFVVAGIVAGSLYGLAATGLVLTYKTSGVFNFAHGAVGAAGAFVFYDLRDNARLPAFLAFVIAVGIASPIIGFVLSGLASRLESATTSQRVVATVGVLLVTVGVLQARYGVAPLDVRTSFPTSTFRLGGVNIGYDQLITAVIAVAGVGALELLFRRTRLGLQMRGVVDNQELLGISGQSPTMVRAKAWMIGCAFATVSGILLAPTVGLDALLLTLVVVQAFGAAALGRFESTSVTFIGGIGIGIAADLLNAPRVQRLMPFLRQLPGVDLSVPFVVLFVVLLVSRGLPARESRTRRPLDATGLDRRAKGVLALVAVAIAIASPELVPTRLPVLTLGAVFLTIFASLFVLVEVSNQVSLCHVAFVAIGATTFCHVTAGAGLPWFAGVIAAGLIAIPVGAFVAIPAIRLSGLFLALATLAFGILVEKLAYTRAIMFGITGALTGSRPSFAGLDSDKGYFFLCLAVGVGSIWLVLLVRRSRLGRLLEGMADSPLVLGTHGANSDTTKVLVFCLSAAMAGIAGALYVGVVGSVSAVGASPTALVSINSLVWVAVLAFAGRSPAAAPVIGALALTVGPSYITNPHISQYLTLAFGALAVVVTAFGDAIADAFKAAAPRGTDRIRRTPVRRRTELLVQGADRG